MGGRVRVNGQIASELGTKVSAGDAVEVDGEPVSLPVDAVTIMLNKPAGYVTTMSDTHGRATVAELIPLDEYPSLFPVGRLDMDTTGLLLFTTDGELGNRLLHPRFHVDKTYIAHVRGRLSEEDIAALQKGVVLEDGRTSPARVRVLDDGAADEAASVVEIAIHEGRKRQVRRMFDAVGHTVLALQRVSFGALALGDLPEGAWRPLTDDEVAGLSS